MFWLGSWDASAVIFLLMQFLCCQQGSPHLDQQRIQISSSSYLFWSETLWNAPCDQCDLWVGVHQPWAVSGCLAFGEFCCFCRVPHAAWQTQACFSEWPFMGSLIVAHTAIVDHGLKTTGLNLEQLLGIYFAQGCPHHCVHVYFLECISSCSVFPSCSQADWDFLASFDFHHGFSVTWRGMEVWSLSSHPNKTLVRCSLSSPLPRPNTAFLLTAVIMSRKRWNHYC